MKNTTHTESVTNLLDNILVNTKNLYLALREEKPGSLELEALLNWAAEECATITCQACPQADGGDYEQAWCVYAHHLNEDEARCIGAGSTIEEALRRAWEHEKQTTPPHPCTSACDCGGSPHGDHCNAVEHGKETSELRCEVCGQHVENCDHAQSDYAISGGKFKSMHKALRGEYERVAILNSAPIKYCEKCGVVAKWSSADCPVCLQDLKELKQCNFIFHNNPDEPGTLVVTNDQDVIVGDLFEKLQYALQHDATLRAELMAAISRTPSLQKIRKSV